jgi:O-antigen ligase
MNRIESETFIAKALGFGALLITVLVYTSVSDPVNVPKMVVLASLAFGLLGASLFTLGKAFFSGQLVIFGLALIFIIFSIAAVIQSDSPFNQNFFGTFGRNTGLLTYLSLVMLMVVTSTFIRIESFKPILWGLMIAGFINVAYCLWVVLFGDFVGWTNPYQNILGTFGNPNFIGAFLGIFISIYVAYLINPELSLQYKLLGILVLLIAFYEVRSSHAVQGVVVSAGGIAVVGFFFIRSKTRGNLIPAIYSSVVGVVGTISVMGALQIGPLTSVVYKTSVSLRGEYWQAAINMANFRPWSGVGMDSYGDWYRRARDTQAMILPGPNVVTNAAHNVPLDLLAYGGIPLFISFLALFSLSAIAVFKLIFRKRDYDWITVGLVVGWTCYHVQSVISINQIGLAIWGWIFNGAVIAYERITREVGDVNNSTVSNQKSKRQKSSSQVISPQLVFGLAGAVGFILAFPAFNSDYQYRKAIVSAQATTVQKALEPSYMTPANSRFLVEAASLFANSNLPDLALQYALEGKNHNPDSFDVWRILYSLPNSSVEAKAEAKQNLIRLDPLNKEWKNLP